MKDAKTSIKSQNARSEDRTHDLRIAHHTVVILAYETCALTS